jgi:hypothetical protein
MSRFIVFAAAVCLAVASDLLAQGTYVCPVGAQAPGERQVGMTQGGNGVAAVPICVQDQVASPQGYPQQSYDPTYWADGFVASAWHADAADVWAVWNERTQQAAESRALDACNQAMGGGCTLSAGGTNSSIAFVSSEDGALSSGWGKNPSAAKRDAANNCEKNGAKSCKQVHVFTSAAWVESQAVIDWSKTYFPGPNVARHRFILVAAPKTTTEKAANKMWVGSGLGYQATEAKLLEVCKNDTQVECQVVQSARNTGVINRYRDETKIESWNSTTTKALGLKRMRDYCKVINQSCEMIEQLDAFTERMGVVQSNGNREANRPFFALAWPKQAGPWNKVALSGGHSSLDLAKQDAIALCQEKSGADCMIVGEADDGIFPMVALYADEKNNLRWYRDYNKKGIVKLMEPDCKDLDCRLLLEFDARKVGRKIIKR